MSNTPRSTGSDSAQLVQPFHASIKRRSFFMYVGATAGATALVLAGCSKDTDTIPLSSTISLGMGDASIFNYAYALEQLEAAFYANVVASAPLTTTGLAGPELDNFTRIAAHEAIHRDFLKAAINRDFPGKLIPDLAFNFTGIDFTKRVMAAGDTKLGILNAAKAFEDLGVAAYNGAGRLIRNIDYLVIAGQIVSVEARHAAYVRELVTPGSFADDTQVDVTTGLDKAMTPSAVVAIAGAFIAQKLDANSVGQ